jgi:hypothetical protein
MVPGTALLQSWPDTDLSLHPEWRKSGLTIIAVPFACMAKLKSELIEVQCPCCNSTLQIDPRLKAVISHKEPEKPRTVEDLKAAVEKLKGEEARRSDVFNKSFEEHKNHQKVLERKFDELFKQAKETPDSPPPKRPFDFD